MLKSDESWLQSRRQVVLAFWATVLLGIPFWYFTTSVSRASLPVVPDFDDVRPTIGLSLQGLSAGSSQRIITNLNRLQPVHTYTEAHDEQAYKVTYREADTFSTTFDGRRLEITATEEQSINLEESIMALLLKVFQDEASRIAASSTSSARDLRVVKYSPSYELVFSLLNGGGDDPIHSWEIAAVLDKYAPLMHELSSISTFSLESQIQFNADLTFDPNRDESVSGGYTIQSSALKNFINSAEWNLASAQSESKPLNFILYVPRADQRPLLIKDQDVEVPTNSFILPQFGSIVIYNPRNSTGVLRQDVLADLMDRAIQHLLILLGLPDIPYGFGGDTSVWRLDGLMRQRWVETVRSAQETLQSITKVVDQIPNMHVPAHVATLIQASLASLQESRQCMARAEVKTALLHSRDAVRYAEEAFFDEKMVSLLYFPDEHKYGVYMPLFGPLLLPLVMAAVRELKTYRATKTKHKT